MSETEGSRGAAGTKILERQRVGDRRWALHRCKWVLAELYIDIKCQ